MGNGENKTPFEVLFSPLNHYYAEVKSRVTKSLYNTIY